MSLLQNSNAMGVGGYTVGNSLRFRASGSAYLSRTFGSSPTSRTTNSISMWVKRGQLGLANDFLFGTTNNYEGARFLSDDLLYCNVAGGSLWITNAVYRDPSAWYHFLFVNDTTNATAGDRFRLYVNGVRQTFGTSPTITQNQQTTEWAVSGFLNTIGNQGSASRYFDGYLAEVNFIDGQALTPSSFGETDAITGVWIPKKYTGTYGTNGFYLDFSTGTSTTTLGYDKSGNSNNWTANNISLTAGATYDWMLDSPTNGVAGERPVGNYAVLNPLANGGGTLAGGNLNMTGASAAWGTRLSTIAVSSGKWYAEIIPTSGSSTQGIMFGVSNYITAPSSYLGATSTSYGYYGADGSLKANGGSTESWGATVADNDVVGIALDLSTGTLEFYKNNVKQGTTITGLSGLFYIGVSCYGTATASINFGQRPFAYTPPSGFKALCTTNLPEPAIKKGNQHFDATTYTGNGSTQSITNSGAMQPDLVWNKCRNYVYWHELNDSVRGAGYDIYTNSTNAEDYANTRLTSFNSNGFSIGSSVGWNESGRPYVAWQWKANGAAVTNSSGSITSQVSANTTAGFSIVTYTGNEVQGATVGHGLGVAPKFVVVKNRTDAGYDWACWHTGLTSASYIIRLNLTDAQTSAYPAFNNTAPTSSVFSLAGGSQSNRYYTNKNGSLYVAYCFAEVPGFSKFGSYTGNGSTDGPFVYTGFRPRWVMWKRTDSTGDWSIMDTGRWTYNACYADLNPNNSDAEAADAYNFDILSSGFKIRQTYTAQNANGGTYIFMAFAENPFSINDRAR